MSRAPPASLVSATIMRQYHTGAVTPRWVGRSGGVRRGPIMRDKLSQTSAWWRWADGVWRRPRQGGFLHEPAEAKTVGKAEEKEDERPPPQNAVERNGRNEKGKGRLQKINKERWTTGTPHTEAGLLFIYFYFFYCDIYLVT